MHLWTLLQTALQLRKQLGRQARFNSTRLQAWLQHLEQQHGGRFSPSVSKKIKHYYSVFVPVLLCQGYCRLAGRDLYPEERERATLFGIITPLYDDFFDDHTLSPAQIEALTFAPHSYTPLSFEERVFQELQAWMLHHLPHPENYLHAFRAVYDTQVASLKQMDADIKEEELYRITYDKSYAALLLYHHLLNAPPSEAFQQLLYPGAGVLQLANDIFDVYKDVHQNIYTVPNRYRNLEALKQKYKEDVRLFNQRVLALPVPLSNRLYFLHTINSIIARGWVALLQLEETVKASGTTDLKELERKLLICDMERPRNIAQWVRETYRFSKMK